MKKMMLCMVAVMAMSCAMAAENVIQSLAFASKKDFAAWAPKKTYPAYDVAVADGVAKVTVKEVAEGAKTGFQLMPFFKQGFKKGVTYKVTGTIKSNEALTVRLCIQLSGAPYTPFKQKDGATWRRLQLKPGEAQNFEIQFVAPEDITALCRVPGIHTDAAKAGTVIECSNFKVIEVLP